jgi:hypothetical protein
MWWLSLDSWNNLIVAFLALGAFSAVAVGVATYVAFQLQKTDAQETAAAFDRFKIDTGKKIADANARQKEAELKLAQLRKLSGPRDIDFDVFKDEIEGKLKAPVAIWYLPDTSDGYWFASRLSTILGVARWPMSPPIPIPDLDEKNVADAALMSVLRSRPRAINAGGQPSGVTVIGNDDDLTSKEETPLKALLNALSKSTGSVIYGSTGSQFMPIPKGTLRIVVAAKPDPMFRDEQPRTNSTK